jgi:hypothetical protein
MADDPDPRPKEGAIPLSDAPHAPFIFYEKAPPHLGSQMASLTSRCLPIALWSERMASLLMSKSWLRIFAGTFLQP